MVSTVSETDFKGNGIALAILDTVKTAQQRNGLRHGDYQRYRQYCTRKLRRIRKSLKFFHGKSRQYIKKKVTAEICTEACYLYIPLYNAERAWSYAMQLREDEKNDKEEKGEDCSSRIKFRLVSRLSKAARWSKELSLLCCDRCDARTALEAEAYAAYMSGNLQLYRESWEQAHDDFSKAWKIYTELSKVGTVEEQDVFEQQLEEINPYMRYCEYNLKSTGKAYDLSNESAELIALSEGSSSLLQGKIDAVIQEARKKQAEAMVEISWRGKKIPVRSEPVRLAILTPQEHISKLKKDDKNNHNDSIYLRVFTAYDEAIRLIRNEQSKYEKMRDGQKVEAQREELLLLESYAKYMKLTSLLERNIVLMNQLKQKVDQVSSSSIRDLPLSKQQRPLEAVDIIHIFDVLLQTLDELQAIPGSQDNSEENLKNSFRIAAFKAFRAFYLAEAYVADKLFAEAYLLYDRALEHTLVAEDTYESSESREILSSNEYEQVQRLKEQILGARCRTKAFALLNKAKLQDEISANIENLTLGTQRQASDKSLLERLNAFDSGNPEKGYRLVDIPPTMQAIPAKPLLFDIAHNELIFPDLSERTKTKEEKQIEDTKPAATAGKTSGGFFGWFRG